MLLKKPNKESTTCRGLRLKIKNRTAWNLMKLMLQTQQTVEKRFLKEKMGQIQTHLKL